MKRNTHLTPTPTRMHTRKPLKYAWAQQREHGAQLHLVHIVTPGAPVLLYVAHRHDKNANNK